MKYFNNANEAFEYYYDHISEYGIDYSNTKCIFNELFVILNPLDNHIISPFRKWKLEYAQKEFEWYLSANPSVEEIKKYAKIWDKMHGGDNIVNSNYGYQWSRNNQLQKVIDELKKDKYTRRAVITIYDGKEKEQYEFDTPCTLNIAFNILNDKLNMSVLMRSNDVWYGFCNDQYCFSELLKMISEEINIDVGIYTHFVINFHLYKNKLNRKI